MKGSFFLKSIIVCLFVCHFVSPALAYWANPVLLSELNDYQNGYAASRPTISADENIIFFVRSDPTGQPRVWEAQRNPITQVFDNIRMLTELQQYGQSAYGTWISEDGKRLYYAGHNSNWTKRQIWVATRNNPSQNWNDIRLHSELDVKALLSCCSLTADEKYIMYQATPDTDPREPKIYYATRNSMNESFSSPQEAYELNAIGAGSPTITPDGLTVYFGRAIDPVYTGQQELWVGSRESLDEPFGNFMPVDEINSQGHSVMGWFSPSWDRQRLYYLQRNGEPGSWDLGATGIFVSHWVDPPEVVVGKNLAAALEAKQAILEELTATIEMESQTLEILDQLQELTRQADTFFGTIQKTKINLQKALQSEILAQSKISESILYLQKAAEEYAY